MRAAGCGATRARPNPADGAPLYGTLDALNACDRFGRVAAYGQPITLAPGVVATFFDAGHILGSASILFELEEGGRKRRRAVLRRPRQRRPAAAAPARRSAAGRRRHHGDDLRRPPAQAARAVDRGTLPGAQRDVSTRRQCRHSDVRARARPGAALCPASGAWKRNKLPPAMQVFLDSPMAISATEIFERHPEGYGPAVAELFRDGRDPFSLPGLHFRRETAELGGDQPHHRRRA